METEKLVSDQLIRGNRLRALQASFPAHPPRSGGAASMIAKIVEIDKVWAAFMQAHDKLTNELDSTQEYFNNDYRGALQIIVESLMELANEHMSVLTGSSPQYDFINRPQGFKYSPMLNDDGTKKPANTFQDSSIINSRVSTGGTSEPSNLLGNGLSMNDLLNISGNQANQQSGSMENQGTSGTGRTIDWNTLFDNTRNRLRNPANSLQMLNTAMDAVDRSIQELQGNTASETTLKIKTKTLMDRSKGVAAIHAKLLEADQYDPTTYYDFEDRLAPVLEKLSEMQLLPEFSNKIDSSKQHIKMPTISMPTFDGDYTKWRWFKDLFTEMVNNRSLSNVEKFVYLRQNLKGECAKLVSHLQLTNDNYDLAWRTLASRYENPRQIMKATINKLFNLEKARSECPSMIKKIHDIFHENMHSILQMGGSSEEVLGMLFHQLLLNKLDPATYALYEQSLEDATTPQAADGLLKFLVKRFQALEQSGSSKISNSTNPKVQFPKWKRTTALVATTTEEQFKSKSSLGSSTKSCGCKDKHPFIKCPKFMALTPQDRHRKIRELRLCINCFAPNHSAKECKAKKCGECSKAHHRLLHFGQPQATSLLSAAQLNNI